MMAEKWVDSQAETKAELSADQMVEHLVASKDRP